MGNCGSSPEVTDPVLADNTKLGSGVRLEEDYKVVGDTLGYGRVATVREGIDRDSGQEVAIKACSKKVLSTRPARISKTNEVEALLKLWEGPTTCPHIIKMYATYEDNNYIYIVTEVARGGDLFQNMAAKDKFSEEDAAAIGRQLLEAVSHCHECNVIHRDLKPENILLADPDGFDVKLVDFGSSAIVRDSTEILRDFMATPFYAAPEVWERSYSMAADLWSVGAVLYVLLTGLPPVLNSKMIHTNEKWKALQNGVVEGLPDSTSPALVDLLEKLLEPRPKQRITAKEALSHAWITGVVPLGTENLEGSMRGIKAYARIRKFQKAAVVLLSVLLEEKDVRTVAKKMRAMAHESGDGQLRETELENLLENAGLTLQSDSLRRMRLNMIGESEVAVMFAVDDFLEILKCRKLALKHLNKDGGYEDSIHGGSKETGFIGIGAKYDPKASMSSRVFRFQSASVKKTKMGRASSTGNLQNYNGSETGDESGRSLVEESSFSFREGASGKVVEKESVGETSLSHKSASATVHGDMIYQTFLAESGSGRNQ